MIEVAVAFIQRDDGAVLLQLRRPDREFPLTWECPGGKLEENGEDHAGCIRRELDEELGLRGVKVHHLIFGVVIEPPVTTSRAQYHVNFYDVSLPPHHNPRFELKDAVAVGWFSRAALAHIPLTPGNTALFKQMGLLP